MILMMTMMMMILFYDYPYHPKLIIGCPLGFLTLRFPPKTLMKKIIMIHDRNGDNDHNDNGDDIILMIIIFYSQLGCFDEDQIKFWA